MNAEEIVREMDKMRKLGQTPDDGVKYLMDLIDKGIVTKEEAREAVELGIEEALDELRHGVGV